MASCAIRISCPGPRRCYAGCGHWLTVAPIPNVPGPRMTLSFGDYEINLDRRELRRAKRPVHVQPQVFDLLVYLVQNRDRVVSKDDLIASVWSGRIVSESTFTSRINAARKAVGDSGELQKLIRTIPRKGFRFVGAVNEQPEISSRSRRRRNKFASSLARLCRCRIGPRS